MPNAIYPRYKSSLTEKGHTIPVSEPSPSAIERYNATMHHLEVEAGRRRFWRWLGRIVLAVPFALVLLLFWPS